MNNPSSTTDQPLRVLHGAARVFNHLRTAIVNCEYQFAERLPSERSLANHFAVARGTIRDALQQLERISMVKRKQRSGTFVNYNPQLDVNDMAEHTSPLELIEARLAIEPYVVKLVVANASQRDMKSLRNALDQAVDSNADPDAFSRADEAFHLMLARCSQNPLLIWIYQRINDIRNHSQWSERKNNILSATKIVTYNQQHVKILQQIMRRDMEGAVHAMSVHLQQAKQDLLHYYEKQ